MWVAIFWLSMNSGFSFLLLSVVFLVGFAFGEPSFAAGSSLVKSRSKLQQGGTSREGGWGSSGGGSGVACFPDAGIAAQADSFILGGQPLPLALKKQITSLDTLDYWEWAQDRKFPLLDFTSTTAEGIIYEMHARVQFAAPIFIYRLQQTTEVISVADWSAKKSVPRITDAVPKTRLPDNCRLIQLAGRYMKEAFAKGAGPTLRKPVVAIDFDQDLYQRLSPLNQAILIVHEQMYLLGQTTGQNTSDSIRPMVMRLFAKQNPNRQLRWDLVATFGDYVLFFGDDFKAIGKPHSPESRFNSFYTILRTIRAKIKECEDAGGEINTCKKNAMDPWALQDKLDDEQSFIFLMYYVVDLMKGAFNAESIIAPINNREFKELADHRIQQSCQYLPTLSNELTLPVMASKALSYCASQFPKGTDQN